MNHRRTRHKFINPTSEKSKINSRIARQRRKALNMTRKFLQQEREKLYKPLPPGDTDLPLLTPDEINRINRINNSEPPRKRRKFSGGGRRKRKTRKNPVEKEEDVEKEKEKQKEKDNLFLIL